MSNSASGDCESPQTIQHIPSGVNYLPIAYQAGTSPISIKYRAFDITITPDTTPPETSISGQPASPTESRNAIFTFTSPDPSATFECKLDSSSYVSCYSGVSYSGLSPGSHIFSVRAKDSTGNVDITPVSYIWVVSASLQQSVKLVSVGQPDSFFSTINEALFSIPQGATVTVTTLVSLPSEAIPKINNCGGILTLGPALYQNFGSFAGSLLLNGPIVITCGAVIANYMKIR